VDLARGEMVEKELNAMIERRSRKGEVDTDEFDPGYMESVRLRAVLEELIADHEEQAKKYLPKGACDEQAQIDQEGEGAAPLPQERKAAAPEERQEGRRDR
jgi:hypothetical protein